LDYVSRRTIASFIGVPSAFCICFNFQRVVFRADLRYQYWATLGPKVQHRQPASPLERDAEEQQVPPSSPTPAASELDQLLVGVDKMKIGAWRVCWQHGCRQLKLRRRPFRTMHWRSQLFYTGWTELVYNFRKFEIMNV
jgi:hypothetical protein